MIKVGFAYTMLNFVALVNLVCLVVCYTER